MAGWRKFYPEFFDGKTGMALRKLGFGTRMTAVYLLTGPVSHHTGLYKLPLSTVAEHLGLMADPLKGIAEVAEYLRELETIGFAFYDSQEQQVYVPRMAAFQIGVKLSPGDKQIPGMRSHLLKLLDSPFLEQFLDVYADGYHLQSVRSALSTHALDNLPTIPREVRGDSAEKGEGVSRSFGTETETETETSTETALDPSQVESLSFSPQDSVKPAPQQPAGPFDALAYVMAMDDTYGEGLGGIGTKMVRDIVWWHWMISDNPYWPSSDGNITSPARLAKNLKQMQVQMPDQEFEYPEWAYEREQVVDPACKLCLGVGSTCEDDPDPLYPESMHHQVQQLCACRKPGRCRWEFTPRAEKRAS